MVDAAQRLSAQLDRRLAAFVRRADLTGPARTPFARRLRRSATGYVIAATVLAVVAGLFVHGQQAFMVAWLYVGAVLLTPALLIAWVLAHRNPAATRAGRLWLAGLALLYVVGAGLLLIVLQGAEPQPWQTLPAVLAPMALLIAAPVVFAGREGVASRNRTALVAAVAVVVPLASITAVTLGPRMVHSSAGWLAMPAALVAVVLTGGTVKVGSSMWLHGQTSDTLHRFGLAVLAAAAVDAWGITATSLADFAFPSAPLLGVHAVTLGLVLLMPLWVPKLGAPVEESGEPRGPASWLAEEPDEDGVLPARLRPHAIVYLAVTLPFAGALGFVVHGRTAFLLTWVTVSSLYTTPALFVTWSTARHARFQASAWRLWFLGVAAIYANGFGLFALTVRPSPVLEHLAVVGVLPCIVFFGAAGVAMMRARSGLRAITLDIVESAIVVAIIVAATGFLVGDRVLHAEASWFTIPTAIVAASVSGGLVWQVMLRRRMPPGNRRLETLGLVLAAVGTVDAWAMVAQGVSGFTLPAVPLLMLQALAMGLLLVLPLYVPLAAPEGLDRLPPHAQVRDGWQVLTFTVIGVPALVGAVVLRHSVQPNLVPILVGVLVLLLVLTIVRQLLGTYETRRLYGLVAAAADERHRLLADVMRSLDEDRHRVASQLHDQAISSYAAFASLAQTAAASGGSGRASVLAGASGRLRDDLAGQAESLRRLMLAVRPLEAHGSTARRLVTPIHAYVDSLWGDHAPPALDVEVDPDLRLDWATETLALRIVQDAVGNVWRHAGASSIEVRFDVVDDQLEVSVTDDGIGFDVDAVRGDVSGLASMRSFAALSGGELTLQSRLGEGTRVVARLGGGPACGATPPPDPPASAPGGEPLDGPRLRIVPNP